MNADAERARILDAFRAAGAEPVDLPVLQDADTLLDLYGEDIRGRAYVTRDPLAGEMMLRPDFTVPVVQMHLGRGAGDARYAYAGRVFRMQELGSDRPSEFDQVGFELFGGRAADAEAEVFALFSDVLKGRPLRVATGDTGVLRAAVQALTTTPRRKAALMRHLWRPGRFRKLLDRFAGKTTRSTPTPRDLGPMIGLRSAAEITDRLAALAEDASEPPIPAEDVARIDAILALKAPLPQAAETLAATMGDAAPVRAMRARITALGARGIDVSALTFEGSYGRTSMEYYDGFVFGFYADVAPLPPVATGGRYDALTAALGAKVPAVGGVVRPALLAEMGP